MGEKHRHFSREFKRDAVQLVTEKGMPVGEVAALTSVRDLHFIPFTGGGQPVGDVCDAFHYHGYLGIEAQVTNTIADFILAHQSHGHGKHDH